MRALVTGAGGFVGKHLLAHLRAAGHEALESHADVTDAQAVLAEFLSARPGVAFHLAAQAFVPESFGDPMRTYAVNVRGTANVLASVRALQSEGVRTRLLFTSSADVYGPHAPQEYPMEETTPAHPANPYAASKLAAEALVLGEVRAFGIDAIVTRAFNHIGPGQDARFAVASFAAQLAAAANGGAALMHVGNLQAKRDFLDVRDVVAAYGALAERGSSGEIYNVCSGTAVSMREVLGELIRIAHVPIEVREDPQRMRATDVPLAYGSNRKLRDACGWSPAIPLRRSLQDVYAAALMPSA